jgi:hypothetical protein
MRETEYIEFINTSGKMMRECPDVDSGKVFMLTLKQINPIIYDDIVGTDLDVSMFRENMPLFFEYLKK